MSPTVAFVWYLVIAGPQGGMVMVPSYFDTRADCTAAVAEYQKQPATPGWSLQCVPGPSLYDDEGGGDVTEEPAQ